MEKSIVLLSGGLDSAVSLAQGVRETNVILTLTINYGQKAAAQEIRASSKLAEYYQVPHQVVQIDFLSDSVSALLSKDQEIPDLSSTGLAVKQERLVETAKQVWVPNRNGLFINIAACFAEKLGCSLIITGFNAEEAVTFPDNSVEFVIAINQALAYSTLNKVQVKSYTQKLTKTAIVSLGIKLGLPFELIWSCYYGDEQPCGKCESCLRFKRALGAEG